MSVPIVQKEAVSTHSRPKAAGRLNDRGINICGRFNSQPPEGGWFDRHRRTDQDKVSTHSRPKAAGFPHGDAICRYAVSTHSRPKAAGKLNSLIKQYIKFQLTAARRRLVAIFEMPVSI